MDREQTGIALTLVGILGMTVICIFVTAWVQPSVFPHIAGVATLALVTVIALLGPVIGFVFGQRG